MNARGQYGPPWVGQVPARAATIYVEREQSSVPLILGAIALGGALLWARHQSLQIEQLYKKAGLPQQSFAASLRQGTRSSLSSLADRLRPTKKAETKSNAKPEGKER